MKKRLIRKGLLMAVAVIFVASCGDSAVKDKVRLQAVAETPANAETLSSPDGKLTMQFYVSKDGVPVYSLNYGDTPAVLPSAMGYELRGSIKANNVVFTGDGGVEKLDEDPCYMFDRDFKITGTERNSYDGTWEPVWGEESIIRENWNELLVHLTQGDSDRCLDIRFRLFDTGLGFRYEFPAGHALGHFVIKEEMSDFTMPGDITAWWIPGDFDTQEYLFTESRLSEISEKYKDIKFGNASLMPFSNTGVQTSILLKSDEGLYLNIHEAALVNYPCMHLDVKGSTLSSVLTPDATGWKGYIQCPGKSPWRSIEVTPTATAMLESRQILNLNDPCALEDVSWIHPVKFVGVWWEMIAGKSNWSYTDDYETIDLDSFDYSKAKPHGRHGANNENVRRYIDFAAKHGFDAVLVEGWNTGWEEWVNISKDYVFDFVTPYPDYDIEALNEYARSKGVKIIMHHETSSSVRNYERHLEEAYKLMNKYGNDAVKSGYVGDILPHGEYHYSQWIVNHYLYCVTEAARHHIMVDAHEAVRPTGLCRTYPNLIGNESARGNEFQAAGGNPPSHTAILPFTRLNGGPMDYTPGLFEQDLSTFCDNGSKVLATITNQLALYVTLYSPLQMAADLPEHYERFMDAFQFIKDVPVDWSESHYLLAEPYRYIVAARKDKKSEDWYVGGITDDQKRDFEFALDFLTPGKTYHATIYADAPDADYIDNPQAYTITRKDVTSEDVFKITAARGGGFAISIKE